MGWLFSRKKAVPKVPFPEGKMIDEKALRFPAPSSSERIIEPDKVKEVLVSVNRWLFRKIWIILMGEKFLLRLSFQLQEP